MRFCILLSGFLIFGCHIYAQQDRAFYRMMFWNTENFFDTRNDSLVNDEEFLPGGERYWTPKRYQLKLQHTFKVIAAVGGWEPPAVIGLCEVENRKVLNDLYYGTPLCKFPYGIVHKESPDKRGIDVAMLYRKDRLRLIRARWFRVDFEESPGETTRDLLYAMLVPANDTLMLDTLHVFVNHWPSRSGGQSESDHKRLTVARLLRSKIDSLMQGSPQAKVVITGDFNDEPSDYSVSGGLGACSVKKKSDTCRLVNLSSVFMDDARTGTHKFDGNWSVLDQFIVSGAMLKDESGFACTPADAHIFSAPFILVNDENGLGKRPFRTYDGYRYAGGFSDHLPVFLDLYYGRAQ